MTGKIETILLKKPEQAFISQENLEKQQKLFSDRITVMFEYQNKSTLEVLLESNSIAGFFTSLNPSSAIISANSGWSVTSSYTERVKSISFFIIGTSCLFLTISYHTSRSW